MQQIGREGLVTTASSAGGRSVRDRSKRNDQPTPTAGRRKRRRSRVPGRHAVLVGAFVAVCVIALAAASRAYPSGLQRLTATLAAHSAQLAAYSEQLIAVSGLGIDEVRVTGQRFTDDRAIFECLDLAHARTLAGFDSARAAARIERLPWIATANITRVFPGRVDITVTERTPSAVWIVGPEQARLVDSGGRILQPVPLSQMPNLPRIAGEGAPAAARALFDMLARVPEISGRVQLATRITGRRWTLGLTDSVRLELPSEGEAGALADLVADPHGASLLATANTVIDLRSRREIAFRTQGSGLPPEASP